MANHHSTCHAIEISDEVIKKFNEVAKTLNINLDDNEDLNMRQLTQSSQEDDAEEGRQGKGKEKEGHVPKK